MSAPNFITQKDFELYVKDFCLYDNNGNFDCVDYYEVEYTQEKINELNRKLEYFSVELEDGRYTHTQFYVSEKSDVENPDYYSPLEWRNERKYDDYTFPYPYSVAKRKRNAEIRRINRWFATVGVSLGFEHIYCVGVYSSGEAVYCKATERAKTYNAVLPYRTVA